MLASAGLRHREGRLGLLVLVRLRATLDHGDDVVGGGGQAGGAVLDQPMAACGLRRAERTRYGQHRTAEEGGGPGGGAGGAAHSGLDDDCCPGELGEQTVPGDEPVPCWWGAGRVLRHDRAAAGDPLEQAGVPGGIADAEPAAEDRDGGAGAVGGECAAVGGAVDAVGRAAPDGETAGCQCVGEFCGVVFAVLGGCAGTDDRD